VTGRPDRAGIARAFFVLSLLTCGGAALADWSQRPPLTWRADDRTVSFGNTQAAPDASIRWETADASDHHLGVVVTGSSDLVVSQDADVDWGVTGANRIRAQSTDSGSPSEWHGLWHDGTDGVLGTGSGAMRLRTAGLAVHVDDAANAYGWSLQTPATDSRIVGADGGSDGLVLLVDGDVAQTLVATRATTGGRQIVLTDYANIGADHDHAAAADPALYVHSATNPDVDNTQWGSLGYQAGGDEFQMNAGGPYIRFSINGTTSIALIQSGGVQTMDDTGLVSGSASDAELLWETADANANELILALPAGGGGVNVPVFAIGDKSVPPTGIKNRDLGFFNAVTNPTLALVSSSLAGYVALAHDGTDAVFTTNAGNVNLLPSGELLVIDPGTNSALALGDVTEVQTTDATATNCTTMTLATDQIVNIMANVVGMQSTLANQAGYHLIGTFHNAGGGGATQVGATTTAHSAESAGAAAWTAAFSVAGAAVRIQVTGAAATTVNWACAVEWLDR